MSNKCYPFETYGNQGPWLHFAHANAYPPGCYRQLLNRLAGKYRVIALNQRPLWPGSRPEEIDSWHDIASDLIHFLDRQRLGPVIGVGHSLGAVATMMAAVRRPDLFSELILIEPVFLAPAILEILTRQPDLLDEVEYPLVETALRRRNQWRSRKQAFTHFRPKPVFERWPDEALWDYVTYGLRESKDGWLELSYPPQWEARIYALPPTDVWQLLPEVSHRTLAIRGADTETISLDAWRLWQETQPEALFLEIMEGGHLVPMERPDKLAEVIDRFISLVARSNS